MHVNVRQTRASLELTNAELEKRVEELLDRATSSETQRDVLQRQLVDTQTALDQMTTADRQVESLFAVSVAAV